MNPGKFQTRTLISFGLWALIAVGAFLANQLLPLRARLSSGLTLLQLVALIAAIWALSNLFVFLTSWSLVRHGKPLVEGKMMGNIYHLLAALAIALGIAYGLGQLGSVGSFFTLFGGMLLGWSLQAPVSGFAAWLLVSLKRPIRPGDRIQFPSLGLVGDIEEVGPMYTVLNQVGGSIGSEEAVGRYILVPNAMLFSQVVINYTVRQEAAYILDEVVVRITYDSDWKTAERILLEAATEVTQDIIKATGSQPYIRSDLYDYGVYLRLRYQTRVKDRAEIAYEINKRIFEKIQHARSVDLAIPYVYSYRAGADKKEEGLPADQEAQNVREIEIDCIQSDHRLADSQDIEQLAKSIATQGLLQPIVVVKRPQGGIYDIVAGHLRFEACKRLGWKAIPAIVRDHHNVPSSYQ